MKTQDVGCEFQKQAQLQFTGSLSFKSEEIPGGKATVFFREGKLYAAHFGEIRGKRAIQHLLRMREFDFEESTEEFQRVEIPEHLDQLLVEAMQAEMEGRELEEPPFAPISHASQHTKGEHSVSARLFIFEFEGKSWVLDHGRYIIGRNAACHICIPNEKVSSFHCTIDVSPASISIHDTHSTNGTFVNGLKVEDLGIMETGDTLGLGSVTLSLRAGLRIRHGKHIIPPTPIDMTRLDHPTAQMPKGAAEPEKPDSEQPIRFEAKTKQAPGSTWKLPRIWRQS